MDEFFVIAAMVVSAALLIVVIWQGFKTLQLRAAGRRESDYQRLAVEALEAQQATAARLNELAEGVAELRARVAAVEKLLREVS